MLGSARIQHDCRPTCLEPKYRDLLMPSFRPTPQQLRIGLASYLMLAISAAASRAEEIPLFDGTTLKGWVTSNEKPITQGWEVVDGVIHRKKGKPRAGHILSQRVFGDFKLSFEWAIAEGGNSGLKYRVRKFNRRLLGCEYQVYDDQKHPLSAKQSSASLYALFPPNDNKNLKPPGEYNSAKIVVAGNTIEHWLNGKQVVRATVGNSDWDRRIADSKFSDIEGFGQNRFGRIMLTDHGSEVWYRNFQLELLPIEDLQGDMELTRGETAFVASVGRDCPVVRLWADKRTDGKPGKQQEGGEKTATDAEQVSRSDDRLSISNVNKPSMMIVSPKKKLNTGAAILLCCEDELGVLAAGEARETALQLNALGVIVVVLKHRTDQGEKDKTAARSRPLQDAQRALSVLRARCEEWGIHSDRIGVAGLAAGGRLAASLASHHQTRAYDQVDSYDDTSCKPNFCLLLRPKGLQHESQSRQVSSLLRKRISAHATPPTLIGSSLQDKSTAGVVDYYLALMEKKIPAELHSYAVDEPRLLQRWAEDCSQFLIDQGIVHSERERPAALTYQAKTLDESKPSGEKTLGDHRLIQILGRDCPQFRLWPNGTGPDESRQDSGEIATAKSRGGNALNIRDVVTPTITIVRPLMPSDESPTGGLSMIVCPGGGYGGLAAEHEGATVCEWLNRLGVTAILLKYRVPRRGGEFPKHHHALQDLQRAIRLVRANAEAWSVDSNRLGVCGFSAGGHLSAMLCANFEKNAYKPLDDVDKLSSRPNFAVLVYPAYLTEPRNSNQLDPDVQDLEANKSTPMFMTVARDDPFARGMLNFYLRAREAGVAAEAHVYASGGHGGGIDPISYPASRWADACEKWLSDLTTSPGRKRLAK